MSLLLAFVIVLLLKIVVRCLLIFSFNIEFEWIVRLLLWFGFYPEIRSHQITKSYFRSCQIRTEALIINLSILWPSESPGGLLAYSTQLFICQLIYSLTCLFFHSSISSIIHYSMYPTAQLFVLNLSISLPLHPTNYSTVLLFILLSSVHPVI